MKKLFLFFILYAASLSSWSQNQTLLTFKKEATTIDKTGMTILGSWAAANIVVSAFALQSSHNSTRYFNEMNIIWNGFNLTLAGLGYLGASKKSPGNNSWIDILRHQQKTEKIFLFNTGLDLAYVAGGAYLKERARRNTSPAKLTGYGNAIMVNGGFLFLFDAIMYGLHNKHGKQLPNFINKLQVSGSGAGIAATYNF
jgi:hypothetical protein